MKFRLLYFAIGFLFIAIILLMAQRTNEREVKSSAYGFMLNRVLAHSVPEISVSDVDASQFVILDARELVEFNVSTIEGARWIGYEDFTMDRMEGVDKTSKILIYCSVGYRSEKMAEKLIEEGFEDVSNLYGGIFEWINQGNEIVDSLNNSVDRIHGFSKVWGIWLNRGERVYE